MSRYKIMVYTIQGQQLFFCHWKMGINYHTRMVSNRGDSIWYTDKYIDYVEHFLKTNIEKLEVKTYTISPATHKPDKTAARTRNDSVVFRGDARRTLNKVLLPGVFSWTNSICGMAIIR